MKHDVSPTAIFAEYQKGISYNTGLAFAGGRGLYETVQQNEDFFAGKQWQGVDAPDLDKPVFNMLRRIVTFFIASVVSDDIGVQVSTFEQDLQEAPVLGMLSAEFGRVMENARVKPKLREVVRDAAVDGDGCLHYYFAPGALSQKGTLQPGHIEAEVLDNTSIYFGNPQQTDLQRQPHVLVAFRRQAEEVREEAQARGNSGWAEIRPDADGYGINTDNEDDKVTVLRRYYRQGGRVQYTDVTRTAVVVPPTATGWKLYPLAWFSWEKVKNQYHGLSAVGGMLPNQIFINKLYAMAMQHVKMLAFPKVLYNRAALPGGWDNRVGAAIGVTGDPNQAVATSFRAADMSAQVLQMIQNVKQDTRDAMGVSEVQLGNVQPHNTSAIVAMQKSSGMPLELQKMAFYQFVEDSVRIWLEMMAYNYGVRSVSIPQPDGPPQIQRFDFGTLADANLRLNIDIGAATYWSEVMQTQTLDGLFNAGVITDPEIYLEMLPAGRLPQRQKLLEHLRAQKAQAATGQADMPQEEPAVPRPPKAAQ